MVYDRLLDEVENTVKKDISPASLEMLDMAVDILKDLKEIEAMESVGYSGRNKTYNNYDNGNSMRGRYERSYSRTGSPMTELENMYNTAQSDKEREIIRKVMNQL